MNAKLKREKILRRRKRVRAKIFGTKERPRICVFRSNKHIYAQLIDDGKNVTLFSANDKETKGGKGKAAFEVGKLLASKAAAKKIEKAVFDRRGYKYHGAIKALAEGAREGGLKF